MASSVDLAIDEDNESDLTDQRLADWVKQINSEA
jgi:flavodoxin I